MTKDEIQDKALEILKPIKRGGLGITMGGGKTRIGLRDLDENCPALTRALVVAPKKSVQTEWKDEAEKIERTELLDNIVFSTYLSLTKHNPADYDVVYLDECHSLLDSHRAFLGVFNGRIVGLTGTPPRYANSEKGKMVQEFCPILWDYVTDTAVEDGVLNDYRIIVHEIELDYRPNFKVETKTGGFMTSEVKNYAYWCNRVDSGTTPKSLQIARIMRMKALQNFQTKEKYTRRLADSIDSKCIIFANTQDQADRLCDHSYHSNNSESEDNLQDFKNGVITELSAVHQLSEGVNVPDLRQGIIMHSYGNERKASQRLGRLLRLNPDDVATAHILCYMNTADEDWVKEALKDYDNSKITWKNFNIKLD
jgi:superfamily II DNA or RNA helicase